MSATAVRATEPIATPEPTSKKRGIRAVLIGPPGSGKGTQVLLYKFNIYL